MFRIIVTGLGLISVSHVASRVLEGLLPRPVSAVEKVLTFIGSMLLTGAISAVGAKKAGELYDDVSDAIASLTDKEEVEFTIEQVH